MNIKLANNFHMEEKKFPWLLRLLSANEISLQILDTYVISKERVLAGFIVNPESKLVRLGLKQIGIETIHDCLKNIQIPRNPGFKKQIKHCFFYHKGKRTKISQKKLFDFNTKKIGLPSTTYIQSSSEEYLKFLTFMVEYNRESFKSTFIPPQSHQNILEKAKELSKYLIAIIETHEKRKILKLQIEFMVDNSQRLWLSYMDFCQTIKEQDLNPKILKNISFLKRSSETLEIINEFDSFKTFRNVKSPNNCGSPRDSLQRQPSVIRKLEGLESYKEFIRIDSPENSQELNEKSLTKVPEEIAIKLNKKEEKNKISDDFIELLSKTKIISEDPKKRDFISEDEFQNKFEMLANELRPIKPHLDLVRKKTQDLTAFKKSPSIKYTSGQKVETKSSIDFYNKEVSRRYKILSPILLNKREMSLSPSCISYENSPTISINSNNLLGFRTSAISIIQDPWSKKSKS